MEARGYKVTPPENEGMFRRFLSTEGECDADSCGEESVDGSGSGVRIV